MRFKPRVQPVLILGRFLRDLDRWKDFVPKPQRRCFRQIVRCLWNFGLHNVRQTYQSDNLSHFQEVFQNLLSDMRIEELPLCPAESLIQAYYPERPCKDLYDQSNSRPLSAGGKSSHRSETYTGDWTAHDYGVIILAATVILCVVVAALLCKYDSRNEQSSESYISQALYDPQGYHRFALLMERMPCLGTNLSTTHKRNCILIACYIGLSTQTIEGIPFSDGFNPKALRPCRLCGEKITSANMKRHETIRHADTQSQKVDFQCRYCSSRHNRSGNRDAHEKTCRARHDSRPLAAPAHALDATQQETSRPVERHDNSAGEDWFMTEQHPPIPSSIDLSQPSLDLESSMALAQSYLPEPDFVFDKTLLPQQSVNPFNSLGQQPLGSSNVSNLSPYSFVPPQPNPMTAFPATAVGAPGPTWMPPTDETFNSITMSSGPYNPKITASDTFGIVPPFAANQAVFPDQPSSQYSGIPNPFTADFQPTTGFQQQPGFQQPSFQQAGFQQSSFQQPGFQQSSFQPYDHSLNFWDPVPYPNVPTAVDFSGCEPHLDNALTPSLNNISVPNLDSTFDYFNAAPGNAWVTGQQIDTYPTHELGLGPGLEKQGLDPDPFSAYPTPMLKRAQPCSIDERINPTSKRTRLE